MKAEPAKKIRSAQLIINNPFVIIHWGDFTG